MVGLKVRDLYEVPAAAIILAAHRELEKLVSTIHQNNFKGALESQWAYLCYAGLWLEPLRGDLDAYMDSVNEFVTGEVTLKLYRGSVTPVARSSPFALYDRSLASFGESGGEFSQHASPGFIELFTLQSRLGGGGCGGGVFESALPRSPRVALVAIGAYATREETRAKAAAAATSAACRPPPGATRGAPRVPRLLLWPPKIRPSRPRRRRGAASHARPEGPPTPECGRTGPLPRSRS